jgi:alpha-N-arabinofuranosidase
MLYGDVPLVDATATFDSGTGDLTVMAVNRSRTEAVQLDADVRSLPQLRLEHATTLTSPDPSRSNTEQEPDAVTPQPLHEASLADGRLRAALPPVSWTVVRLRSADTANHHEENDR